MGHAPTWRPCKQTLAASSDGLITAAWSASGPPPPLPLLLLLYLRAEERGSGRECNKTDVLGAQASRQRKGHGSAQGAGSSDVREHQRERAKPVDRPVFEPSWLHAVYTHRERCFPTVPAPGRITTHHFVNRHSHSGGTLKVPLRLLCLCITGLYKGTSLRSYKVGSTAARAAPAVAGATLEGAAPGGAAAAVAAALAAAPPAGAPPASASLAAAALPRDTAGAAASVGAALAAAGAAPAPVAPLRVAVAAGAPAAGAALVGGAPSATGIALGTALSIGAPPGPAGAAPVAGPAPGTLWPGAAPALVADGATATAEALDAAPAGVGGALYATGAGASAVLGGVASSSGMYPLATSANWSKILSFVAASLTAM